MNKAHCPTSAKFFVGDFNGDGRDDFLCRRTDYVNYYYYTQADGTVVGLWL